MIAKNYVRQQLFLAEQAHYFYMAKAMLLRQRQGHTFIFLKLTTFVRQEFSTSSKPGRKPDMSGAAKKSNSNGGISHSGAVNR
jgi:hypothetical protein